VALEAGLLGLGSAWDQAEATGQLNRISGLPPGRLSS
jgi:hypothetical protein